MKWHIEEEWIDGQVFNVVDPTKRKFICVVNEDRALAQLISASPELLEALELLVANFSDRPRNKSYSSDSNYLDIAKKAIAKAKGLDTNI